jgi:hypothetical protein
VVGKYVVDSLEGTLEKEPRNKWRWRYVTPMHKVRCSRKTSNIAQ